MQKISGVALAEKSPRMATTLDRGQRALGLMALENRAHYLDVLSQSDPSQRLVDIAYKASLGHLEEIDRALSWLPVGTKLVLNILPGAKAPLMKKQADGSFDTSYWLGPGDKFGCTLVEDAKDTDYAAGRAAVWPRMINVQTANGGVVPRLSLEFWAESDDEPMALVVPLPFNDQAGGEPLFSFTLTPPHAE